MERKISNVQVKKKCTLLEKKLNKCLSMIQNLKKKKKKTLSISFANLIKKDTGSYSCIDDDR